MSHILLDLGKQPLVGNLSLSKEESLRAKKYPLKAHYNKDLKINLDIEIEPNILYEKYSYHSGVSKPYIKHCEDMFLSFKHLESNTIIDVGGYDGTLLKTFKRLIEKENYTKSLSNNHRYINVDASESFKSINEKAGIEYKVPHERYAIYPLNNKILKYRIVLIIPGKYYLYYNSNSIFA